MRDKLQHIANYIGCSVAGILSYVIGSILMLSMVGEGCGIIAVIILPILVTGAGNSLVCETAKTRVCYKLSSITIILYILSAMIFRIIDYHGIESVFFIIYHFIGVLSYTIVFIRELKL